MIITLMIGTIAQQGSSSPPPPPPPPPPSGQELPTPLRTIQVSNASQLSSALSSAQPGDHIVLANGTYSGSFSLSVAGTATNPIVVRAANLLGATISGSFALTAAYGQLYGLQFGTNSGISQFTGTFCKIRRCKFNGGYTANEAITVEVRGTDIEIANNEFANFQQRAVSIRVSAGARRVHVHHNWFHDWIGTPGTNVREPIQIGQGATSDETTTASCIVEYNLFDNCNVDDEAISIKSCGNIVQFNTLLNSSIASIHNRVGESNQILANWVENSGGIRVMDKATTLLGNRVLGSGNYQIFAGDRGPDDPVGNPPRYYPAAWDTIMAGNEGPITVGHYYSSASSTMTVPARNTVIEAHTGSITYVREENTSVSATTNRTIPAAVKLTETQVGPASEWDDGQQQGGTATIAGIASVNNTSIINSTLSSYTWSNITLPSGTLLLATVAWRNAAGVATCTITHPALSTPTLVGEAVASNATADRSCRIMIWQVNSTEATGTLTVTMTSGTAWQCGVAGWVVSGIGSRLDATTAVTSGDTQSSITMSAPASPTAALGLVVGACFRTLSTATLSVSNWTSESVQKQISSSYFAITGAGFVGNQPSSGPQFSLSGGYGRPLIGVAVRFAGA